MEAVKNLIANVPTWIKRLDDLSVQIDQRQLELAQIAETQSISSSPGSAKKSLRNRGSTESLKPRDDDEAHPDQPPSLPGGYSASPTALPPLQRKPLSNPLPHGEPQPPSSPGASNGNSNTPSALQRHTQQVMVVAQAKARATVRKRQRTDSVISAEGAAPKYRTRSMIIVYYDSYVQSFFEELVKFVSASRNLMRKAKMAAKVAQIKRLAELEMPDEDEEDDNAGKTGGQNGAAVNGAASPSDSKPDAPLVAASSTDGIDDDLPPLRYVSTRQMRPVARAPNMLLSASGRPLFTRAARAGGISSYTASRLTGIGEQPPDAYDDLDKGLEYVQSMCEHAAHQFLRDGDCAEEIGNIKRRLGETKELADKEMERVMKEDPDALNAPADPLRTRSYRLQSMRREGTGSGSTKEDGNKIEVDDHKLEVDEGIDDMDEEMPKLVYKSTRMMR